jgi:8-amino-7-oxononanoate synthase
MHDPAPQLADLESLGLLRALRPLDGPAGTKVLRNGKALHNFASNDYLGLATHPQIKAALIEGVERFGAGAAASRLVCGTLPPHRALEEDLAEAKGTEASLVFSSGFAAAMGTIPAIVGKDDFILLDKLAHACLVDASRLSGATMRVFPHNDMEKLRRLLFSIRARDTKARILIVTESVFSMDGDVCPLDRIVSLAGEHEALVLLDEAHGFGVLGETGMGLAEASGLAKQVTFHMSTLSKAAGLSGGTISASRTWIDWLVNRARSFIYSTAPPPAIAHAARESLRMIRSQEGTRRRAMLFERAALLGGASSPILPVLLGGNERALMASRTLEDKGFLVPAMRYPTVPRGTARLRISVSADHDREAIYDLKRALADMPDE